MFRKLIAVTSIVLLLSLAFASVSFAQTGSSNQGGSPSDAFTSPGTGRTLQANQQQWYAFQYSGDNSPIMIRLRNASNMMFSVWTQQDLNNAAGNFGSTASPTGRSTSNSQLGDDQYWTGSFNSPGTYYVMVENASGGQGGSYTLDISGSGVSSSGANSTNDQSTTTSNQSGTTTNQSQTGTGSTSSGSTSSSSAQGSAAPSTLPTTGGEMASVFPMLLGGIGALSIAAGALLRRRK